MKHLEEEFKQFLVINQVYKEEWEQINRDEPDKALELVGLFSDNVLQTVYEKIRFLEKRTPDSCFVFYYTPDEIQLRVLQVENAGKADLSTPESIHEALKNHAGDLSFFKSSKKYSLSRESEIHQTLEQGAVVSTADFWEMLEKLIP
ncbi:MAG: hypothetical protein K0R65_1161 [Crocinitomicaceae bacterium]|nr:hypothetical protein [Crocinitomicaceae bacterium]